MKGKNIFWGLFFVVAAALVLLNQFGDVGWVDVPFLILLVFMIPIMVKSVRRLNFFGIVFPIAALFLFYMRNMRHQNIFLFGREFHLTPAPVLLAALFLSVGLSILFGGKRRKERWFFHTHGHRWSGRAFPHHGRGKVVGEEEEMEGERLYIRQSFGECIRYVKSEDLDSVEVKASFGAVRVFFTEAKLKDNRAELYFDVSFAGVELFVPKEWRVENRVNVTFGGVAEKNQNQAAADAPVLYLSGGVNFAGVEVVYV